MNNPEALEYLRGYFHELFDNRNVDALDGYLDTEYFDDDIGDPRADHIRNSKEFLRNLFREKPSIGVNVSDAMVRDGVITAFLEWSEGEGVSKKTIRKGVAVFELRGNKIRKRHTYIYYSAG